MMGWFRDLFRVRREPLRTTPRSAWVDVVTDRQAAKQTNVAAVPDPFVRRLDEFEFDPSIDVQPVRSK